MDLSSIPIMNALKKHMNWLNTNQSVISQNIANADTPGYRAKQLEKNDFSGLVDQLSNGKAASSKSAVMKTNSARHMNAAGVTGDSATIKKADSSEESLNGNSVVLEDEMLKLADNQMKYGMVVNLYKKNMGLLKIAMGKGRGR